MNILALICSSQKGGNTDILVDRVLRRSQKYTSQGETLYLYDYTISPCSDCCDCQKREYVCTLNDGMQEIISKIEKADLIILGIPFYEDGPSGRTKRFIARMRPFALNGKLRGKRWILVTCSSEGSRCSKPLLEMLEMLFGQLGVSFEVKVLAKVNTKGKITGNVETSKKRKNDIQLSKNVERSQTSNRLP